MRSSKNPKRSPRNRQRRVTVRTIKKRESRERILQAAATIARREGLAAASIPRVMREAGLTAGAFYAHFTSKADLDAEVIRTVIGALPGRALQGLENLSGLAWVQRATSRYLTAAHRDNSDGCAYPSILSGVATGPNVVKGAFAEALELRIKAFETQAPPISGVTRRERALALMALTIGGLLLARASATSPISQEILDACQKWALPEIDKGSGR